MNSAMKSKRRSRHEACSRGTPKEGTLYAKILTNLDRLRRSGNRRSVVGLPCLEWLSMMRKTAYRLGAAAAAGVAWWYLAPFVIGSAVAATYQFYFNNVEQGANSTANPQL